MNLRGRTLLFFLFFLYQFSVGYYTIYGVYKSYSEYFCTERRADTPDYRVDFVANGLLLNSKDNDSPDNLKKDQIFCSGGDLSRVKLLSRKVDPDHPEELKYLGMLDGNKPSGLLKYKTDLGYFELSCRPEMLFNETSRVYTDTGSLWVSDYINEAGFHVPGAPYYIEFNNSVNSGKYEKCRGMSCTLIKSPETCELSVQSKDKFYKSYISISAIIGVVTFLSLLSWGEDFSMRIIHRVIVFFSEVKAEVRFCNPVDGKAKYYCKGENIHVLVEGGSLTTSGQCAGLNDFQDLDGFYKIIDNGIFMKTDGKARVLPLTREQKTIISGYFLNISLDPKNCVVDERQTHFLCTEKVIESISSGQRISCTSKTESGYVRDVGQLEYGIIMELFNLKKERALKLIEHNKLFFGEYKLKALTSCLRGKMMSYDRPNSVKNSQWKIYTSDFLKLFDSTAHKFRGSHRPSKALNEVMGCKAISVTAVKASIPFLKSADPSEVELDHSKLKVVSSVEEYKSGIDKAEAEVPKLNQKERVYLSGYLEALKSAKSIDSVVGKRSDVAKTKKDRRIESEEIINKLFEQTKKEKLEKIQCMPSVLSKISKIERSIQTGGYKKQKDLFSAYEKLEKLKKESTEAVYEPRVKRAFSGIKGAFQALFEVSAGAERALDYLENCISEFEKEKEDVKTKLITGVNVADLQKGLKYHKVYEVKLSNMATDLCKTKLLHKMPKKHRRPEVDRKNMSKRRSSTMKEGFYNAGMAEVISILDPTTPNESVDRSKVRPRSVKLLINLIMKGGKFARDYYNEPKQILHRSLNDHMDCNEDKQGSLKSFLGCEQFAKYSEILDFLSTFN